MTSHQNGPSPSKAEHKHDKAQDPMVEQTLKALNQSLDDLDYASQIHLKKARTAALSQLDRPTHQPKQKWLWLTAVPAALAVVLLLPQQNSSPTPRPDTIALVQDFDILVAGEDVDMIRDMEFWEWIDEQEIRNTAGST